MNFYWSHAISTDSRIGLSLDALQKIKYIFNNKKLSIKTKMRAFDAYVSSIFLYNSELWTLTSSIEKQMDSFQRRLLRKNILNIKWPTVMNNEDVYNQTKANKWSIVIKKRRMRWLGHAMKLPEQTRPRKAMRYANEKYIRPRGSPPTTWLSMMKKQLIDNHKLKHAILQKTELRGTSIQNK